MGFLGKVVDAILLLTFLSMSLVPPLLDAQALVPESVIPDVLVRLYKWYTTEHQDYLLLEQPAFFMALMKLEIFFVWPLAMINLYGLLNSKPWFKSTCLIFGSAIATSTTAMVGDMLGSKKPMANKLAMMYSPFIALGFLAVLRGLLTPSTKAVSARADGQTTRALKKRV
ncbi:putative Ras-related small GTP-binding family protein [Hibiscus syriacus]|uniref:Ras-related small GTP-binding family protein n=1 Tax=Hibiscus syriacus TaxID=106335 RepID=A0A6A2WS70_HIBSY|nr:sigma intracellular receptor 2-like isoform X1 [Hibiscus syriacus]KAE8657390.1 putative Ras-related small GTP-binding family protein [Hibiscus syriacus]